LLAWGDENEASASDIAEHFILNYGHVWRTGCRVMLRPILLQLFKRNPLRFAVQIAGFSIVPPVKGIDEPVDLSTNNAMLIGWIGYAMLRPRQNLQAVCLAGLPLIAFGANCVKGERRWLQFDSM